MALPSSASSSAGDATRRRLVEAALVEFAAHGYEGASTRVIAERAGVHQPLINYHFRSKADLWRASVSELFDELAAEIAPLAAGEASPVDDAARLCSLVDVLVRFAARRPELNRIMVAEATADSVRLAWITEVYTAPAFRRFAELWGRLRAQGRVVDLDPMVAYYTVVGAASLLYANAPEARRITGREPTDDEVVDHHAEMLCAMLVTSSPSTQFSPKESRP
jgi:TetR/AcrR family transcriptional regulator